MKITINDEEWYPIAVITRFDTLSKSKQQFEEPWAIEVPDETVEKWERMFKEFDVMQDEINEWQSKLRR